MTEYTYSLIFLALPGTIVLYLANKLVGKIYKATFEFITLIVLFSVLSYCLYAVIDSTKNKIWYDVFQSMIIKNLVTNPKEVRATEIFFTALCSVGLLFVLSYANKYNWLNRIAHKINASNKMGDKNCWTFFHNLDDTMKAGGWIYLRDNTRGVVYFGHPIAWSEDDGNKEIIMTEVSVFTNERSKDVNAKPECLYESPLVYISCKPEDVSIEIPNIPKEQNNGESPSTTNTPAEQK